MKYFITILVTFFSFMCLSQDDFPIINIIDAINKKTIDYKSSGRHDLNEKSEYVDADGQYYGKSMLIVLHNNTDDTIWIFIPEGLLLMSEDTVVQDMLITKPMYALLRPKQTKTYPLYAMCAEMHDKVPATIIKYKIARNPDKKLVSIAQTIKRSYMQNVIGQGAVWAYTDNATVKDLKTYGATDETIALTLDLLSKAKVETKLSEELNFVPTENIERKKDSIIASVTKELDYANAVLKYKAEKMELSPYLVYSGIGIIVLLIGTTAFLASRRHKEKNNLT